MTFETDFWGLFWQQLARGARDHAVPAAVHRAGIERLRPADVPNASGLFNLMRNLGGAIGLALIDTVLEQRTPAAYRVDRRASTGGRCVGGPSGRAADRALHRRADRRDRRSDARPGGAVGRARRARRRLQRRLAADRRLGDPFDAGTAGSSAVAIGEFSLALNCAGRLQSIRAKTCSRAAKNRCHPPLAPW